MENAFVDALPDETTMIQCETEQEWLDQRLARVTASEAAVICGESRWSSPYALWGEKHLGIRAEPTQDQLERWQWGHALEPLIAARYEQETGRPVYDPGDYALMVHSDYPYMSSTLDRLTRSTISGDEFRVGVGPLEMKSRRDDSEWLETVPMDVQIQTQHQMACTGTKWASVAVLLHGQHWTYADLPRDQAFIDELAEACDDFMGLVKKGTPPETDGSPHTRRTLALLHPNDNGESVLLHPEHIVTDARRDEVVAEIKALQQERETLDNKLRAAIGVYSFGVLSNASYSLKTQRTRMPYLQVGTEAEDLLTSHGIEFWHRGGGTHRVLRKKVAT